MPASHQPPCMYLHSDTGILVAQTAHPAFLTQTLPGLLTRAVHTPGERHTAVAVLTLPSWFAPALPWLLTKPIFCVASRAAFPASGDARRGQKQAHRREMHRISHPLYPMWRQVSTWSRSYLIDLNPRFK